MSRRYVKILICLNLLFFTQIILAQLSPATWNGCQNCQNVNSNSNFPVSNNNAFNNGQQNCFSQLSSSCQQTGSGQQTVCGQQNGNLLNELQSIPEMSFVNGQITDLINFASKINKRQLTENNINDNNLPTSNPCSKVNGLDQINNNKLLNNVPITFFPNTVVQNNVDNFQSSNLCSQPNGLKQGNINQINNVPITFFPNTVVQNNVDNVMSSNPCFQENCLDQGMNNNQINNIPINFYPNLNPCIQNNLVPNNVESSNYGDHNNPVLNNIVPNTAVPISFYPNISPNNAVPNNIPNNAAENSVAQFTTNSSPCSNGINTNNCQQNLPVPCSNSLVDLTKINSLILTGEACNNGLPFSVLPANLFNAQDVSIYNDIVDNGYKIPRSLPTDTSYPAILDNNDNTIQNNNAYNEVAIPLQNKIIGKLIPANNNLANNVQDALLNNDQLAVIGNNIYYNKQLISNQQQSVNQWQPPANQNNHNIPTATNWPAINTGRQLSGNFQPEMTNNFNLPEIVNIPDVANYNLPDLANINMLNLGELGSLPIFSGLPVISITETVTVVDPEQLNQNHVYGYL